MDNHVLNVRRLQNDAFYWVLLDNQGQDWLCSALLFVSYEQAEQMGQRYASELRQLQHGAVKVA